MVKGVGRRKVMGCRVKGGVGVDYVKPLMEMLV